MVVGRVVAGGGSSGGARCGTRASDGGWLLEAVVVLIWRASVMSQTSLICIAAAFWVEWTGSESRILDSGAKQSFPGS